MLGCRVSIFEIGTRQTVIFIFAAFFAADYASKFDDPGNIAPACDGVRL